MSKQIKVLFTIFITFTTLSIAPANAATAKTIWKDGDFTIKKFCDGVNLIYFTNPIGWRGDNPTFFVSPNDAQCKRGKK